MKTETQPMLHASQRVIDGMPFPWPIDEKDLARIKAQIKKNPGHAWPSRIASEWDVTEGVARRLIRDAK
jgi:hypothetical protein